MNQKDIEALHEQASGHYLGGNLEAALETWRQLLRHDPDDERAREGVELCERMSGCESESVVTEGESPFAVGGLGETEPAEEEELPEPEPLTDPLDKLLDLGPTEPQLMRDTPAREPEPPADASSELDLSDLRDESDAAESVGFSFEELAGEPTVPKPAAEPETSETVWHFGQGPPEPEPTPEPPAPEPPPQPAVFKAPQESEPVAESTPHAAAELHRRASDLLAAALKEMERGDKASALRTLERLLILDEHNTAARSLVQKLQAEIGGEAGALELPDADEPEFAAIEIPGPESAEPSASDAAPLEPCEALTLETALEASLGGPSEETHGISELPIDAGPTEAPAQAKLPPWRRITLPAPKIWIPLAAVLVLGAGYLVWSQFMGEGVDGDAIEAEARQAKQRNKRAASGDGPGEVGAVESEPPVLSREEQIAEAVGRAESALAIADYAAAVIAFNDALALDAENDELLQRLDAAGESYRLQEQKRERWEQAVNDFDQGDFQAALSYFYRLPSEEENEQVRFYKLNGWYNLGVLALRNRDCTEAASHFREARDLAPEDVGVIEAMQVVSRCTREGVSATRAAISGLEFRGLEASP